MPRPHVPCCSQLAQADGETTTDPTIGCCWDADRLDLGRVGIEPEAEYQSTVAAREMVR